MDILSGNILLDGLAIGFGVILVYIWGRFVYVRIMYRITEDGYERHHQEVLDFNGRHRRTRKVITITFLFLFAFEIAAFLA